MRKLFKFVVCFLFALVVLMSTKDTIYAAEADGVVKEDTKLYKKADKNSEKICDLKKKKKIVVIKKAKDKKWYYIKVTIKDENGKKKTIKGYTLVSKIKKETTGDDVVDYAKKFIGNPYKYGGTSLTKGTDCSGFVLGVYKKFGYNLPHSSSSQRKVGTKVSSLSKAKPGDIICYNGHVAIYMGNNKIIHASNRKTGIKISNNANYKHIISIRRLIK